MKLVLAIIQKAHSDQVLDALTDGGFRATRLASTGGFRREGNTTLIIGVDDPQVDPLLALLRGTVARQAGAPAQSRDGSGGRGAVFVLPLADSFQL
jgi:uncharacterized protein YaaQ